MANPEHLAILKQGVDVWNVWRRRNPDINIDLIGANLCEANLAGIDLSGSDINNILLIKSNLTDANLTGVFAVESYFIESDLIRTNLSGANLNTSDLTGTDLTFCDFRKTDLLGTSFNNSIMWETNLSEATVGGDTDFGNVDLSRVIGLETIHHYSPSRVDMATIFQSKGKIPLVFLRGCGLSDWQIEYAKLAKPGLEREQVNLIVYDMANLYSGEGLQFYKCFISHSSKDIEFTEKFHEDLQDNGVRCWYAPEDMKIGDRIRPRIDQEIRLRDKLLVILSENSIASEWVGDEVEAALEEESVSRRTILFPIRLDDSVLDSRSDWAAKIKRRRHIGDFSRWQNEAEYQEAFECLLEDLKSTEGE